MVKFLSLWQPWASLIAEGIKKYETRPRGWRYLGPLAIAATKTQPICMAATMQQIYEDSGQNPLIAEFIDKYKMTFPQGAIVAVAEECHWYRMSAQTPRDEKQVKSFDRGQWEILIPAMSRLEIACGNWREERWAGKLINVVKVDEPIPFKGGQGLQNINDVEIVNVLMRKLKEGQ